LIYFIHADKQISYGYLLNSEGKHE